MSLEVAISYREQIRQRHEAGQKADDDLRQAMLRKIEITRQTGQLIADARGDFGGPLRHVERVLAEDEPLAVGLLLRVLAVGLFLHHFSALHGRSRLDIAATGGWFGR